MKAAWCRHGWALVAILGTSLGDSAQPTEDWRRMRPMIPRGYWCVRTEAEVRIDGQLQEAAWQKAAWSAEFADIEGEARPKPRHPTRMKMLWDDRYLYVGAFLEEPNVWGTLTNHDSVIFQDNDFEVFLDPDGDTHQYYEFEINALNTGWDLRLVKPYKDGGPALNEWEIPGLKTAVHIEGTLNQPEDQDRGWSVEIAFPWTVLAEFALVPCPPRSGDQWRVNFSRVEWETRIANGRVEKVPGKKEDNWVWSPQGIVDMHRPERWGLVEFVNAAPSALGAGRPEDGDLYPRNRLFGLYYAQRQYRERHNAWATKLSNLDTGQFPELVQEPELELVTTADGFEGRLEVATSKGQTQRWKIRQDARIWHE